MPTKSNIEITVKKYVCYKCGKKRVRKRLVDLPSIKAISTIFCPDCIWWSIEKGPLLERINKEFDEFKIKWETKKLKIFTDK